MHELGILNSMIHTAQRVVEEQGITEVDKIVIEIGELSGIVPRYIEECWPAARYKSPMENTELELKVVPGIVKCRDCGEVFNAVASDLVCPKCGSRNMELLERNDMIIRDIISK